jgi:hypothetical protein
MSSALVGFIGVIAGAVTTGGVQATVGWLGRRSDAVAAARLVGTALDDIIVTLQIAQDRGSWPKGAERIDQFMATWQEHQGALARSLDAIEFDLVAQAMGVVRLIGDTRAEAAARGERTEGLAELLADRSTWDLRVRVIEGGVHRLTVAGRRVQDRVRKRLMPWRMEAAVEAIDGSDTA